MVNRASGELLAGAGDSTANGAAVVQATAAGTATQQVAAPPAGTVD